MLQIAFPRKNRKLWEKNVLFVCNSTQATLWSSTHMCCTFLLNNCFILVVEGTNYSSLLRVSNRSQKRLRISTKLTNNWRFTACTPDGEKRKQFHKPFSKLTNFRIKLIPSVSSPLSYTFTWWHTIHHWPVHRITVVIFGGFTYLVTRLMKWLTIKNMISTVVLSLPSKIPWALVLQDARSAAKLPTHAKNLFQIFVNKETSSSTKFLQ